MVKTKIGRNDPCWCGSGIKYKRCHLNRHEQRPIERWQAAQAFREAYSRPTCLAPDGAKDRCSKKVVRAHTVPKSSSLQAIARNGHVYSFVPSMENLEKNRGKLLPELVGINRASTFTGFCSEHDNRLFAPLEKREFVADEEQCFLLAYRALARECYTKEASASLGQLRQQADKGRSRDAQQQLQALMFLFDVGVRAGVRDNRLYKEQFDKMLEAQDFRQLRSYVICLESPPPVMCSAAFFPEEDFSGCLLQDIADLEATPDLMSVTSFASGKSGYVVFSWLEQCDKSCLPMINTLSKVPDEQLASALTRLFFEHIENVFLQPDWWESLDDAQKVGLIARMNNLTNFQKHRLRGRMLTDDGLRIPMWAVTERRNIGYEQ